jgi:hypothetical protein
MRRRGKTAPAVTAVGAAAAAVAAALALGGCGGGGGSPRPEPARVADACVLVTRTEAGGAIGETVTAGVLGTRPADGGAPCVFYGPAAAEPHRPDSVQADSVRVTLVQGSAASGAYGAYRTTPGVRPQRVAGYGQSAFYDGSSSLNVLQDGCYVRILISRANGAPLLSAEEKLAREILPKL